MRLVKLILLLAMVISLLAVEAAEEEMDGVSSLRGVSRFLAQKGGVRSMKCNKYPRICRVKGSPGRDCCKKRCVNVRKDRANCGKCGHKCKLSEICCKGKCVNPFSHNKHCGGCGNSCGGRSRCSYGLCSYSN